MAKKQIFYNKFKALTALIVLSGMVLSMSFDPYDARASGVISDNSYVPALTQAVSLSSGLSAGEIEGRRFINPQAMKAFYAQRANKPYWTGGVFNEDADFFLTILEQSWKQGLNPSHYHVDELRALDGARGLLNQSERELLLTDAFIRYAMDMSGMRVDPEGLRLDPHSFRHAMSAEQATALLSSGKILEKVLADLQPKSRTYKLLQDELVRLSQEPPENYLHIMPLGFGDRMIRPGDRHERMNDLRLRLDVVQLTDDALLYDDRLSAAVMKFQRENGLNDDGIIGSQTLAALNRTKEDLMLQIIANLERLRWVDEARPQKFVVVNVPSATLWAIDDGQVEFEMPVIVGRPERPTEAFIAQIKGVRFNPDWTVPPTIKKKDLLPKLREDPDYFINKGIEVFTGYGPEAQTLDPTAIDWENMSPQELAGLRMVQVPGAHNALGRVRVLMPNGYNIYLHDTNERALFGQSARAISSGCVRMKEPLKMASFIMRGRTGWNDEKMQVLLDEGQTTERYIPDPIPVYLLYYTNWVDPQGRVVYGTDIYDQDKMLIQKLAKVDGFAIPGHNVKIRVKSDPSKLVSVN